MSSGIGGGQSKPAWWLIPGLLLLGLGLPASAPAAAPLEWSSPQVIDPGNRLYGGVSCPTTTFCAAADNAGNVFTSTDPAGGASTWTAANVDSTTTISGISCPSPSLCVAVDQKGNVLTSTNPTGGATAWQVEFVDPGPVGLGEDFSQVSCPSTTFCAAVDTEGNVLTSTDPTGDASAWDIAKVDPGTQLHGLSCPSVGFCAALDYAGNVLTSTNPAGGIGAWAITKIGSGFPNTFGDISCFSPSLCVTGDLYENIITSTNAAGPAASWTTTNLGMGAIRAVSCPSLSLCVIGNDIGGVLVSTNPMGGIGAWTLTELSDSDMHFNMVDGIACPSIILCIAVDREGQVTVGTPNKGGSEEPTPPLPALVPAPTPPNSTPAPTRPKAKKPPKKKPLKCRKGFKKRKVQGKLKCVKVKKKLRGMASRRQRFAGTSSDTSLRDQCIDAALVMPKVKRAYIAHPGHKPFENDSAKVGAVQTTNVAVWYPAMSPWCAPFVERHGGAKFEKQVGKHKKWATYARYEDSWGYSSNDAGGDGVVRQESGHGESDLVYWHPGERFRMILQNRARDPEGNTLATKNKTVSIQVRRR